MHHFARFKLKQKLADLRYIKNKKILVTKDYRYLFSDQAMRFVLE